MLNVKTEISTGTVNVVTSDVGGLSSEQIADMAMDKLMLISDTAPPAIKEQAEVFRRQLREIVFSHIELSRREERATLTQKLSSNGHQDIADIVRRL